MKGRINFYLFIAALVVLDSVLLRNPNLLGKLGLIIYQYHYLRTFPRTLLTVTLVISIACVLSILIQYFVKKDVIKSRFAKIIYFILVILSSAMLIKTVIDFSSWTYSHTGLQFKLGAYLLPVVLIIVFVYDWITMPAKSRIAVPQKSSDQSL